MDRGQVCFWRDKSFRNYKMGSIMIVILELLMQTHWEAIKKQSIIFGKQARRYSKYSSKFDAYYPFYINKS